MDLEFPRNTGVKDAYWQAYYMFVRRWAVEAGLNVIDTTNARVWAGNSRNVFSCVLNDKQFLMDFSDFKKFQIDPCAYDCPYFKWHYSYDEPEHDNHHNVYPLCVLQDYEWKQFKAARNRVNYTADGHIVTNNQRVRAAAKKRRTLVQQKLLKQYSGVVSIQFKPQLTWWLSHNTCLAAIHVPGARNDMLDRGQLELMGLGVCVISPEIVTVLGDDYRLEPFKHYVPVESNYGNLIEMIQWCKNNRGTCIEIGVNAQYLFDQIVPPEKYWNYIRTILDV
jgi:hypothetical protein